MTLDLLFPESKAKVASRGELAAGHVSRDWLGARPQRFSRKHRGWVTRESEDDTTRVRDCLAQVRIAAYEVDNAVLHARDADEGLRAIWEIRRRATAYGSWEDDLAHRAGRSQTRVESTLPGTVKVTIGGRQRLPLSPSHPSR